MPAKCDRCGVESTLEASFFKEPTSFSTSIRTYCPACWLKRQQSTVKWVFLSTLGLGALGALLWLAWPKSEVGRIFFNVFLFQVSLTLTILPHELGHAWMARLLGMRVFQIHVGSGRTLFKTWLFGFEIVFRAVPLGGLVLAAHPSLELLRTKRFAFVLAGPAVNLLLGLILYQLLDWDRLRSMGFLELFSQPGVAFLSANLLVLIENLRPHNIATEFGAVPSDGKQLFVTPFLSREKRQQHHIMSFLMEASFRYQEGDIEGARTWLAKGLAMYPDDETLLNWEGVIELELGEYERARECFSKLLQRDSKQPLMRPLMMNNIAYANALIGDGDLIAEADTFSREAMAAVGWMPAVCGTRGTVLAAMGRIDEALPLLHDSMSRAELPNHKAQNACIIAEAECRRGNVDVARSYLVEARKLSPNCHLLPRAERALREAAKPA